MNEKFTKFVSEVAMICSRLEPEVIKQVIIGNERKIDTGINKKDFLIVTVLNEEEKKEIESVIQIDEKIRRETKRNKKVGQLVASFNEKDMTTSKGIQTIKKNNAKPKRNLRNRVKRTKNKVYKIIPKTKEEIKKFLKDKGIKIGVGIAALAVMGTIASTTLTNKAENIDRFNQEFTSIDEVEERIKGIIDDEILKAIDSSELGTKTTPEIYISRLKSYKEESQGIKIIISGLDINFDNEMVLTERKGLGIGNIPESLEKMAESYLEVKSLSNQEIKDGHKNKAISLLKRVERIASRKDLKIRKNLIPEFLRFGDDYVMKDKGEGKTIDDGDER